MMKAQPNKSTFKKKKITFEDFNTPSSITDRESREFVSKQKT